MEYFSTQGHYNANNESLYLLRGLKLLVSAVKAYCATLNHVFSLVGKDLTTNHVISKMLIIFEETIPLREVKPLDWNLSLALWSLTQLLYEPLKLPFDKHLT